MFALLLNRIGVGCGLLQIWFLFGVGFASDLQLVCFVLNLVLFAGLCLCCVGSMLI